MADVPALGERGEGWVLLQFVVMAVVVAAVLMAPGWPNEIARALSIAGAVLAVTGAALLLVAARALGRGMTPFPRPSGAAVLVERGPYRFVRHPVYSGGILFFAGLSLAFSPWALVAAGVLSLVWALKLRVEERMLEARYPDYAAYRARTRARLLPFVY